MTTANSVNFQTNSQPPQDHSESYPFFQQNKNKKQAPHHTEYLSSDDDYLQPDLFAPYTQEYRNKDRDDLIHIIEYFLQIQRIHEINNQYICQIQLIHNLFNQFNHKTL